ncbi:hypothetical protein LTR70_007049 [Exophiala xenobiotica]|nr:hypothetical protein LTR70_007049 [Exophiala xenobiotica]
MTLPSITPPAPLLLQSEPLTPAAFAAFGTVIASPLPSTLTSYPPHIPTPAHPDHQPHPVPANQSTALKTSPISPLTNNYPAGAHGSTATATGLMSIFSSFPRQNTYIMHGDTSPGRQKPKLRLKVGILERHPYTTQTFCPFNYSRPQPTSNHFRSHSTPSTPPRSNSDKTYMLILVAPTTPNSSSEPPNPPDLRHVRAFLAPLDPNSNTAVAITYAPGTWHAPMIVLGARRVDFLVTQFANGVPEDDCQEVLVGNGPDSSTLGDEERRRRRRGWGGVGGGVEVDVSFLLEGEDVHDGVGEGGGSITTAQAKAKL